MEELILPKEIEKKTEEKKADYREYPFQYWSMNKAKLFSHFKSSEKGLSSNEAKLRIVKYGKNEVKESRNLTLFRIVLNSFSNPISIVLFVVACILFLLEDAFSALIIIILVILSAVINSFQEYSSKKAVKKLQKLVSYTCNVLRDGRLIKLDVRELVPGDIVYISTGDRIPADLRLFDSRGIQIDESLITGEYYPVSKVTKPIMKRNPIPQEMKNIAFTGSIVKEGNAFGIVIATGKSNFIGRTIQLIESIRDESNFEKDLKKFSQYMLNVIILVVILVALVNIYLKHDLIISLIFAVILAVGLIPEPLPLMIATVLSHGTIKLSSKGVIVKRISAIEDLGNVNILCCDKTGTLTENRLRVMDSLSYDGTKNPMPITLASVCSSFEFGSHLRTGSIDSSIQDYLKVHDSIRLERDKYKIEQEISFDYERQMMSVVARQDRTRVLIAKGAPEALLSISSFAIENEKLVPINKVKSNIRNTYSALSAKGLRAIAVGIKEIRKKKKYSKNDEVGLIFVGFVAFTDPPKHSAMETLQLAKRYGIDVKIITGDGAEVTKAIANQLNFDISDDKIMSGYEINKAIAANAVNKIEKTIIFARATPQQKLKIIKMLKSKGHVVAYLGDGANDSPPLVEADVGISVNTGSDVSKESADIILTRKSLHSIIDGILIGRTLFTNIIKYLRCTFAGNFGNMFTIAFASGFLKFIPLLPSQLLFLNFFTDTPLFALSYDKIDDEELRQPKRWKTEQIIKNGAVFGAISTAFDLILIFYLIYMLGVTENLFRTLFFLEIILSEVFVIFSLRSTRSFFLAKGPSFSLILAVLLSSIIGIASVFPPLASFFSFETPISDLLIFVVMISVGYALVTELIKYLIYRNNY